MAVYTDSPAIARRLLNLPSAVEAVPRPRPSELSGPLLGTIFDPDTELYRVAATHHGWGPVLVRAAAPSSQYDGLIALARTGLPVPDRLVCIAAEGTGFHGFRGRSWAALAGNIHVTVQLAPQRRIARFDTAFTAMAAVSLAEAADAAGVRPGARIKWVNDVLVGGAKVGGVLACTQSRGAVVESVVLGLGLNVEATPAVERSAFVPTIASLRDFPNGAENITVGRVLPLLLERLAANYELLLENGYRNIMQRYRDRSSVLGEQVTIWTDPGIAPARLIAAGRVESVGDGLELHLAGRAQPISNGRLLLGAAAPEAIS
jgi:biotin-(acetyl-CoA carboxylase) ligase